MNSTNTNPSLTAAPLTSGLVSAHSNPGQRTTQVLHLINGEHYSGAERVQDLLAASLPEFNYRVGFATTKPGIFASSRTCREAPIYDCSMKSRVDFRAVTKATEIVNEQGYQLIHAHTPRSLMIANSVGRKTGLPVVYHVHSPVGRDSDRRIANWINARIEQRSLKKVEAMICVSESLQAYMLDQGHDANRLHVVPNGVPCLSDQPFRRDLPTASWTIGTVALFRPRKGTEILLQAAAQLKTEGQPVSIHAVGPFETEEYGLELKGLADQLGIAGDIHWTGFTTDAVAEFQKMDLFVLPSLYGEGLPMVVLESMASGVPVIASNVEGIPQAIRDRVDGLIFEAGNAEHLVSRIREMMEGVHSWDEMRNSAHARQRDHFSDRSMAAGVARVYDTILDRVS